MRRHDKRIAKIRANMKNVRFEDLVRAIEGVGWVESNVTGSHHRYEDPGDADRYTIIVKPHGGRKFCHPVDVKDVLAVLDSLSEGDDDGGQ